MCKYACATLYHCILLLLLDPDSKAGDGLDKVVVVGAAMWAFDLLRELGEAQRDV